MDNSNLKKQIDEIINEFGVFGNPQYKKLSKLAQQTKEDLKYSKKSTNELQESIDYLRICIKYQVFDLEATRRENNYLRRLLEEGR